MMNLGKAAIIYSEMGKIFKDGDSPYLTEAIKHQKHKICDLMHILNSEAVLYIKRSTSTTNIIKSLKVDDIEVVGLKRKGYYMSQHVDKNTICELAKPAPFGKGNETVYDEEIRKALEISGDRIKIQYENPNVFKTYFNDVFIPKNKKFSFKLYKMQIYKEGGKFKRHKDTVHAPNHYATLVLGITYDYMGGDLVLYGDDGNELTQCNFNTRVYESIMFLTDVDHEVLPVTSGIRIVLQYDVYLEDNLEEVNKENLDEETDEETYEEELEEDCVFNIGAKNFLSRREYVENLSNNINVTLLDEIDKFMNDNPKDEFCFLLTREYPLAISIENLKAGDRTLYDILSSKYSVEIGYVVNSFKTDYEGKCDPDEKRKLKVMNYSNTQKFLNKFNNKEILDNKEKDKNNTHLFISSASFNQTKYESYIEYTGNEAAEGEFTYVSVVLSCCRK